MQEETQYSYRNRILPKIKVEIEVTHETSSSMVGSFTKSKLKHKFASLSSVVDKKELITDYKSLKPQEASIQPTILNNTNKLHTVQNTIYQIHKAALTKYLNGGSLDPRLKSMNLLKASQMNDDEIQTLQKAFFDTTIDNNLQEKLQKVLNQFKVKSKNNRQRYMKYFRTVEQDANDEVDIHQLTATLKDILDHKLKCQKLFSGTYLVDPTSEDLQRQLIHEHKIATKHPSDADMMKFPSIGHPTPQAKSMNLPVHNNKLFTGQAINSILSEQKQMITSLKDRFSRKILKPDDQLFVQSLYKQDYAEISYQLQRPQGKRFLHTMDENGQYPIHIAVQLGDPKMLQILLKNGADRLLLNMQGKSALQLSQIYINDEIDVLLQP